MLDDASLLSASASEHLLLPLSGSNSTSCVAQCEICSSTTGAVPHELARGNEFICADDPRSLRVRAVAAGLVTQRGRRLLVRSCCASPQG